MGRDYGRVQYRARSGKWEAFAFKGRGEKSLGTFDSQDAANARLRRYVTEEIDTKSPAQRRRIF